MREIYYFHRHVKIYPFLVGISNTLKGRKIIMDNIVAIIVAVVGSGGISAIITSLMSARKYKAEATSMEQKSEIERRQMEQEMSERLHQQFAELADRNKKEYEEQRAQNKLLEEEINKLNIRINELMNWIMTENASYRTYLEDELRKLKPDFVFPKTKPMPGTHCE